MRGCARTAADERLAVFTPLSTADAAPLNTISKRLSVGAEEKKFVCPAARITSSCGMITRTRAGVWESSGFEENGGHLSAVVCDAQLLRSARSAQRARRSG